MEAYLMEIYYKELVELLISSYDINELLTLKNRFFKFLFTSVYCIDFWPKSFEDQGKQDFFAKLEIRKTNLRKIYILGPLKRRLSNRRDSKDFKELNCLSRIKFSIDFQCFLELNIRKKMFVDPKSGIFSGSIFTSIPTLNLRFCKVS